MSRPTVPGKFQHVACAGCAVDIRSYLSNPRVWCSRACRSVACRAGQSCEACGGAITAPRSHNRRFCSFACRSVGLRLEAGRGLRNEALASYRKHAAERSIEWLLPDETVDRLFAGNCHWCGIGPSNRRFRERAHGDFVYSGIDRVDNTKPYVDSNCVSCCQDCNFMKRDMTPEAFVAKAIAIARRHACV